MAWKSNHCCIEVLCGQARLDQVLCISGAADALGAWHLPRAVDMHRSCESHPRWFARLPCSVAGSEFKLAIRRQQEGGCTFWESLDNNRSWPVEASAKGACLKLFFGIPGYVVDSTGTDRIAAAQKADAAELAEKTALARAAAGRDAFERASCERTAMELAVADLAASQQEALENVVAQEALAEKAALDQVALENAAVEEAAAARQLRLDHQAMSDKDDSFVAATDTSCEATDGVASEEPAQAEDRIAVDQDPEEEADFRELLHKTIPIRAKRLHRELQRARQQVAREHRACSAAWQASLSNFSERDEQQARDRGIPAWAVIVVARAQVLVEEAICIYDLLDVYASQVQTAKKEGVGLLRGPLLQILEMCDVVAQRLHAYVTPLEAARAAFNEPESAREWPIGDTSGALIGSQRKLPSPSGARQAPTKILSPVKLGKREPDMIEEVFHFVVDSTADLAEAALMSMAPYTSRNVSMDCQDTADIVGQSNLAASNCSTHSSLGSNQTVEESSLEQDVAG